MKTLISSRDMAFRIGFAVLLWVVFAITVPGYGSWGNAYAIMESCALIGIIAVGVSVTMLAGELDLSVGSVAAVAGIISIGLSGHGALVGVLVATVVGVAFGAVQGFAIHKLGISSLVITLGTLIAIRGVAFVLSGEKPLTLDMNSLDVTAALRQQIGIFSPFSLLMIVVFVCAALFLRYTRPGREIYAIGGARKESRTAGVPQARPMVIAFTASAGLASLAGALASLRAGSAAPDAYEPLLLGAVTAALIGGLSLYGGRGSMLGVFIGVVTLQLLLLALSMLGAQFWAMSLASGAVLLVFLVIDLAGDKSPARDAIDRWKSARSQSRERRIGAAA